MSHFPKYMRTGYYRKGTSILQELKRASHIIGNGRCVLQSLDSLFLAYLFINRKFERNAATMYQYKTEYTVLRDTELDPKKLAGYNADEVEAAKKRTGLYMDK